MYRKQSVALKTTCFMPLKVTQDCDVSRTSAAKTGDHVMRMHLCTVKVYSSTRKLTSAPFPLSRRRPRSPSNSAGSTALALAHGSLCGVTVTSKSTAIHFRVRWRPNTSTTRRQWPIVAVFEVPAQLSLIETPSGWRTRQVCLTPESCPANAMEIDLAVSTVGLERM